MPINVFGKNSSSHDNGNKIETSIFLQKPCLRANYIESDIEEDIEKKNKKIKNLPCPVEISDAVFNFNVDSGLNHPSTIRKTTHVDFGDKILDNVRFVKVNRLPAVRERLTPEKYIDEALSQSFHESSVIGLGPVEELNLDEQDSKFLQSTLTSPKTIIKIPTKSYVDSLHENSRSGRDSSSVYNDQNIEFDNFNLTKLASITVNRAPIVDNELSTKKRFDDEMEKKRIQDLIKQLKNYLKVSVGKVVYNLTKKDKTQTTVTTMINIGNSGGYLLPLLKIVCFDRSGTGRITNFSQSTKTDGPPGNLEATSVSSIGDSFMYIETSASKNGQSVFFVASNGYISIQISNFTFYCKNFSAGNSKTMVDFRNQLLTKNKTRSTRYNIPKNDRYSNSPTH